MDGSSSGRLVARTLGMRAACVDCAPAAPAAYRLLGFDAEPFVRLVEVPSTCDPMVAESLRCVRCGRTVREVAAAGV